MFATLQLRSNGILFGGAVTYLRVKTLIWFILSLLAPAALAQQIGQVTPEQLASADTSQWLILDVRSAQEFETGHVPGAINIAHSDIADKLPQLVNYQDKPVVLYCRSGKRAAEAAKVLMENDFSQVKQLQGDMPGWLESGNSVEAR